MGARTQLFTTTETTSSTYRGPYRYRAGRYSQWRSGANMAVCAAQVINHLNTVLTQPYYRPSADVVAGVAAIYAVNRITGEASGLGREDNVSACDLAECGNNCGCFLVHLTPEGYRFGLLIGPENGGDLATVTGVDGLMDAYGADWGQVPEDTPKENRAAAETLAAAVTTLRIGEAMGFLMDQDTATRGTRAQLPGVTTHTA